MTKRLFILIISAAICSSAVAQFVEKEKKPDNDLPNVLLVGDSISIGYTEPVKLLLKGKANVYRIPGNGRATDYGRENVEKWIKERKYDLIHFNWGLWDLCYRNPESKTQGHRDKVNGKLTHTPEQYKKNLEAIVASLKKSGAMLVWCSTTPVPKGEPGRIEGDEIKYNKIAETIMKKKFIMINDLHAHAMKKVPDIFIRPGDVHYTKEGSKYLAEKVASVIQEALQMM